MSDPQTIKEAKSFAELVAPLIKKAFPPLKKAYAISEALLRGNYESYLARSNKAYSNICTILDPTIELSLESVYVPLTVKKQGEVNSYEIAAFPNSLFKRSRQNLIIDSAGMGKSTLSRFLFLRAPTESADRLLPILVELRRMRPAEGLLEFISREIELFKGSNYSKEILVSLLDSGLFLLILDGVDEIQDSCKPQFVDGLREVLSKCSACKLWVTSRNEPLLTEFPALSRWRIEPLHREGAYKLISNYERNKEIARQLTDTLKARSLETVETFLGTPLLVVLLVGSYEQKPYIPVKRSNFYYQVFDAVFERHDALKGGYVRARKSNLGIDQFHCVLRALCFLLFRDGAVEIEAVQFDKQLEEAKKLVRHIGFVGSDLKYDLLHSVPMLIEEGGKLRFAHKSMIDYFAAAFVCYDMGARQAELLESLYEKKFLTKYAEMLRFCADLDFATFRKTILRKLASEICSYKTRSEFALAAKKSERLQYLNQASFFATFSFGKLPKTLTATDGGEPKKMPSLGNKIFHFSSDERASGRFADSIRVEMFDEGAVLLVRFRNAYSLFLILAREQSISFLKSTVIQADLRADSFAYFLKSLHRSKAEDGEIATMELGTAAAEQIDEHGEIDVLLSRTELQVDFDEAKLYLESLAADEQDGVQLLTDAMEAMTVERKPKLVKPKLVKPKNAKPKKAKPKSQNKQAKDKQD
jgi:hypothetical protein